MYIYRVNPIMHLEGGLAVVSESWRLDGADIDASAQLVHHQRRERLAVDVLSDDHERLLHLDHLQINEVAA